MATRTEGHAGRSPRLRRSIGALGAAGLAVLGTLHALTIEPAPRVRVLWRPDVSHEQRTTLEETYLLLNPRDQLPEGSVAYDLLDTSPANIRAIVLDPAIADTNDIERNAFSVPFDVDYGGEWMWLAHRLPGLRNTEARTGVIVALAALMVGGLVPDGARAWQVIRRARQRPKRRA
jgi:hypothetical protein